MNTIEELIQSVPADSPQAAFIQRVGKALRDALPLIDDEAALAYRRAKVEASGGTPEFAARYLVVRDSFTAQGDEIRALLAPAPSLPHDVYQALGEQLGAEDANVPARDLGKVAALGVLYGGAPPQEDVVSDEEDPTDADEQTAADGKEEEE